MNAIWVRRFVDALVALFALVILGSLIQLVGSIMGDSFGTVTWEASGVPGPEIALGDAAGFSAKTGDLTIEGLPLVNAIYWLARLTVLGLMLAVFVKLRGILGRIVTSDIFSEATIDPLRQIGWFLLIASLVSIGATIIVQAGMLNALPPVEGIEVHPSISWEAKGVNNIWLEYEPPILSFLMAFIAFLSSSAFRSGKNFREDSESVV
ncbi:DUF2975 domain-containing protein [Erythrobacter sp. SD-21]|uniref:DUF2975 domain-containing protein n=1 Tax=Erythrobacter sp. SD-21 TaxID=161528 RepID=UPI000153FBEE|nr:DUF2975 domain-containing protein [Erythrobacter sp. SD-21]EDL50010.1 hypothetical protein ED21_26103 [Erythrobacter sp. SD-21]